MDLLTTLVLTSLILTTLTLRRPTVALRDSHSIRALLQYVRRLLTNKTNRACSLAKCLAKY